MRFGRCVCLTAMAAALALAALAPVPSRAQTAGEAAPSNAPTSPLGANIAAIVNDDIITTYDVQQRALLIAISSGVRPTADNTQALLQQALRSLIDERLQIQEMHRQEKEQKFTVVADDKEVDDEIADIAKGNNTTPAAMRDQLAGMGIDIATLRDQIRAQSSWQRWIGGRYGSRIRIGNDQIEQASERLKASQAKPQFQVSEIFLDASKAGGMNEATEGAKQLISQIQQGAPFGAVARQFSSAPTAANGGDLGWISASELRPELAALLDTLPVQQISQPIPVSDGVYILTVRDKRAGGVTTLLKLKQVAVPLPAQATGQQLADAGKALASLSATRPTCDNLEAKAAQIPNVTSANLGEADANLLAPEFRTSVTGLQDGQLSAPLRTQAGLHMLMVCGRRATGAAMPSRDQIENRLRAEQLSMISRRSLRDLRNSATIETP